MLRVLSKIRAKTNFIPLYVQKQTFLTNDYQCSDAWSAQTASPILTKINLNDFYNILDQNFTSKGVISAIDVDIFANAIRDPVYLEELKDLLHKLRLSAETSNTLESTHHATIRNFIEYGHIQELIEILKDPLNFGVFLDNYSANILLDKLITLEDYEKASTIASLVMLQEDFSNDITCALCQYACYKYITTYSAPTPTDEAPAVEKNKKVEEVKIRIKYLRNPYFDDHFDLKDPILLAGKTLAWVSERTSNDINKNLEIIGWLKYKKIDKLLNTCKSLSDNIKVHVETVGLLKKKKEAESAEGETRQQLDTCIAILERLDSAGISLETSLKDTIENAINKAQNTDILQQQQLFRTWIDIRQQKLEEQTKRLDRAKRMQMIQDKQEKMKEQEQKLWFFDNEEAIDLQIEEKEKLEEKPSGKKSVSKTDEDYIPPEILPKRK